MSLEAKNISYLSGNKYLFRNLNFNLLPGQLIMIQGQNGAGKTTLLKILVGLLLPKKGEVCWAKEAIAKSLNYHANLAYLGHQDGIHLGLSPVENMMFQAALGKGYFKEKAMLHILNEFSLPDRLCQQLSAGQRRKVALSALLLKNKPLWILDEPYTSLDKQTIALFNDYLYKHLDCNGMIVMVSHLPFDHPHHVINL